MANVKMGKCPYNLEKFQTFEGGSRRKKAQGENAYLVLKRDVRNRNINARLLLPESVIVAMHECMDFEDFLEYRVSRSAGAIALVPGPNGVKISRQSNNKGNRGSMSVCRAADLLHEMFGDSHFIYLMVEYYEGVVILRPTGETSGTIDPESSE